MRQLLPITNSTEAKNNCNLNNDIMKKLIKKIKISGTLEVLTGLHIGGNSDSVKIGGIDRLIIRSPFKDNQPYIPGSSLKGKMRCLLEQTRGCNLGESNEVVQLFGSHCAANPLASRLIVRDAYLTKESGEALRKCLYLDAPYTESKYENTINRIKGTADNPRQTERIPAGALFNIEMIVNIWEGEDEEKLKDLLNEGICLIENDYLGGSGSRGYGQVKFNLPKREEWK